MHERGQALLIILLSMSVVLTVVLSAMSLSVTDITTSTKEEDSFRAFSAAEAGIEQALIQGTGEGTIISDPSFSQNSSFNAVISDVGSLSRSFVYPANIAAGETATVWFVSHLADGTTGCGIDASCFTGNQLEICWGGDGDNTAIEVAVYNSSVPNDISTMRTAVAAFDPDSSRTSVNQFSSPDSGECDIDGVSFSHKASLNFPSMGIPRSDLEGILQFALVRPLYTSSSIKVGFDADLPGNNFLPSQGLKIESVGVSGDASRKLEAYKLYSDPPSVFSSVVHAQGGLIK